MPEAVLEFKARDGAWYAGTAVFEEPFLRVHFEHFPEEEDERWLPQKFKFPQDVKKMIRPASQPMQDSQCSGLRRGAFLCVACRRPSSDCFEYYDAKLQQFRRSPHKYQPDGQECCMCEFEVEWLGGPLLNKRQFVSCGDICLRTPGDIEDDPVIKDYIGEVKSGKVSKSLGIKDISDNAILTPEKKKAPSPVDQKRQQVSLDGHEQSVLENGQKGINTSLQCGQSSNQMGDCGVNNEKHTEGPPLKKTRLNTQSETAFSSRLPDLNESAKKPVDIIQIDSDKEEEEDSKPLLFRAKDLQTGAAKDASPAKITESLDHSKLNDEKKLHVPLVDEFSAHDFSGLSKEQMFSCVGNMAACSCVASQRHCCKNESCPYEAVGFIPIAPYHLTGICGHRKCKPSCKQKRKRGQICALSATSQVCSQFAHSQAGNNVYSQDCEEGGESGDTKKNIKVDKASKRSAFCEGVKVLSYYQFLLVENIEKDIMPFKVLKAARKVSSGALTVYMWPSLEYETTRKGYICYQDSEAAEAAYLNFSAGKFIITSSKGRPWVVSRVHRHKLDWIQLYNISTAAMFKEDNMEAVKEEVEEGDLLILYKGTEEYTMAVGKQKLFRVQQEKLRLCYQKFIDEEKELETLT